MICEGPLHSKVDRQSKRRNGTRQPNATDYFKGKWLCEECIAHEARKRVKKRAPSKPKVKSEIKKPKPVKIAKPKKLRNLKGVGEAWIVDPEPLGTYIRAWVVKWLAERPHNVSGIYGQTGEAYFYGPIQYLSEQTGMNLRRIRGIINGEFERVPLSQADLLLTVIGENWRLAPEIDDVVVKQNPTWSNETWHQYMHSRGCI